MIILSKNFIFLEKHSIEGVIVMGILEALVQSAPYIHKVLNGEAIVAIAEKKTETILKYIAGKRIDTGYVDGQKVYKNDEHVRIAFNGKNAEVIIPKEVVGVEIKALSFPIYEKNIVVGALVIALPIDNEMELQNYMQQMGNIIKNFQESVHNLASESEELAATSEEIDHQTQFALEDAKKTNSITNFIKGISRQTNLLGLNASIEAARAGQHGAGFNIVAQEVQKLSSQTSKATEKIETFLESINMNLTNLKSNMEQINRASNEQTMEIQSFSETIEELVILSNKMEEFMHKLIN